MKNQFKIGLVFLFYSSIFWGQDSLIINSNPIYKTISYLQFNTMRDAANIGIQGRNIALRSFSNLPNPSFAEIHNSMNIDGYFNKKNSASIGLYYTVDNWSNVLYKNSLGIGLKKKIKNFHIGVNIEKNIISKDSTKLIFGDMIDPRIGIIYPTYDTGAQNISQNYLSIRPSIIYNNEKLTIGLSMNNINNSNQSLIHGYAEVPKQTTINASYLIPIKPKLLYTPLINYSFSKYSNTFTLSNIFTYYTPRKIHFLVISYTNRKWLSGKYGINFNNRLKFFAEINIPIYYSNYFPLSAQGGMQYSFKSKNK